MENQKDELFIDTASSDFFSRKDHQKPHSGLSTPKTQSCDWSSTEKPTNLQEQLSSQLSQLKQVLSANQMKIERLECKEDLKTYTNQTNEQLNIIYSKGQGEIALSHDNFQKNMSSLDRQLSSLKLQWKDLQKKQEEILNQNLEQLKSIKANSQSQLSTLLKDTNLDIKCKIATFHRELKQSRRSRIEKKGSLLQQLQMIRSTGGKQIEFEHKKRAEYQQILLILLDKTCQQGMRILRNIC